MNNILELFKTKEEAVKAFYKLADKYPNDRFNLQDLTVTFGGKTKVYLRSLGMCHEKLRGYEFVQVVLNDEVTDECISELVNQKIINLVHLEK